uniref:Schwannomin interacting protein 1 C-terminal domain-containing protein n=1 Tax=Romanomermis culicivorax TaxID=13658 RepID=A0A915IZR2_ROMCU
MYSIDATNSSKSVPKNGNFRTSSVSALDIARRLAGGQDCDDLSDNEDHFAPILTFSEAETMLNLSGHATQLNVVDQNSSKKRFSTIVRQEVSAGSVKVGGEDKEKEDDDEEDASSCLGSSVTCSETSFELGRTEDFESHFTDQQQQQDAQIFVLDNNNKSLGNVLDNLKINNRSSAENGSTSVTTTNTILVNILEKEEQKSDQCFNVIEGNVRINDDDDVNPIFSTIDDQQKDCHNSNTNQVPCIITTKKQFAKTPILSEEVRRRLAFDDSEGKMNGDDSDVEVNHKTFSNININNRSKHKQSNVGMEICFVNDGLPSEEEDDFNDEDSMAGVPKSLSTPNLGYGKQCSEDYPSLERSASSSGDSEKRASELRRDALARQAVEDSDCQMRKMRLEREAKVMLTKAKQAARMQMELEKQLKLKRSKSDVEKIVGVTLGKRKLTRPQLSKMCITQLLIIINDLHARIQSYNEELVHLLIERDTLHMEQDSMLVDVQDLIQHQRQDDVKVPDFVAKLIDLSIAANNGLKKQFSFKLLKKVIPSISKD